MKLMKYIPYYDDCIDIPITKRTWVFVQNTSYIDLDGVKYADFCVEIHHESDYETMVLGSGYIFLNGNESKKEIKKKAIEIAFKVLPELYYEELNNNIDYANFIYETLGDIFFGTHQYRNELNLGKIMYDAKERYYE